MISFESFRLYLFIGAIAAIYVDAFRTLIRFARKRQVTRGSRVVLILAGVGLLCMAYGYAIEPNWLSVSHVSMTTAKLPKGAHLRIAHISDVHSEGKPRLEPSLPEAIAKEHPDVIVFTGDSLNSKEGLPVFKTLLQKLSAIAPTYVVKGNWDVWYWNKLPLFKDTGAVEVNGVPISLEIRGVRIWVTGVAVDNDAVLDRSLSGIPPDQFSIFLHHYPDLIKHDVIQKADLYCAGHTHGGQVALPLFGAVVTFSKFGKRYEAGLYREGHTTLYVNRGIGMEGFAPAVRFWARPELTIMDVSSSRDDAPAL